MLTNELRQQINHYAGFEPTTEDIEAVMPAAERKLEDLIRRFGDDNGKRRQPHYLAQLIVEAMRSNYYALKFALLSEENKEKRLAEANPIS